METTNVYGAIPREGTEVRTSSSLLLWVVMLNLVLAFIRPQEYVRALRGVPVIPAGIVACFLIWVASRKNLEGPMGLLVALFLLITTFSHIANSWFGGAAAWFPEFLTTVVMFYFVAAAARGTHQVQRLMLVFVISGLVMVAHSIQQSITGYGWTPMTWACFSSWVCRSWCCFSPRQGVF